MKLPFGFRVSDERMVGAEAVPNGLNCGCVCAECGSPLVAKQGEIKEWHFAHAKSDECPGAVETAVHKMAKQMLLDRQQIMVPRLEVRRDISGPTWRKTLVRLVHPDGLVNLRGCREEVWYESRRPDIAAVFPSGHPFLIEVAFSHFCGPEKISWFESQGLAALEVDISMSTSASSSEIALALERRLFEDSTHAKWLYHHGIPLLKAELDAEECEVRDLNARRDFEYLENQARKEAEAALKAETRKKFRDIEFKSFRLTSDLTLRVARSEVQVTMKGHGNFKGIPENLKTIVIEAGRRFRGNFDSEFHVWKFRPEKNRIVPLYQELSEFVEQRLDAPSGGEGIAIPALPEPPVHERPSSERFGLSNEECEIFEERAAIVEFDGLLTRRAAEDAAYKEIQRIRREKFFGA